MKWIDGEVTTTRDTTYLKNEYNIDDLLEKDGLFREKFNDEILNGDVYQMFGDKKVVIGRLLNGKKENVWTEMV